MAAADMQLLDALDRLGPHDHLCLIYETRQEQFAAAIPFLRIGLERGEKCLYIVDDNSAAAVLEAMRAEGIDLDPALKSGALALATKQDAYLKQGYFDPEWMIRFLEQAARAAVESGFSALRVTGEMTWALGGDPGAERLMEYESKLNYFFPEHPCLAICQYNRRRFSPELIVDVIRTHPIVIYGGTVGRNFYYVPPDDFLKPNQAGHEVERLLTNIRDRERVEADLRRAREELELRVEERTAELARANQELQARIIERRQQEEQIRRLNRELGQRVHELTALNRELEAFTYSVSHDLRAPLRHLDGFAKILAEEAGPGLDAEHRRCVEQIQERARHMGQMVDDLLTLSRMGRRELARRLTELRPLVEEVLRELKPDLEGREIRFEIGELPAVDCDRVLVKQVFSNLLDNAVKFTRPRKPAVVEVGRGGAGGRTAIFVRDNGVGFSMKYAHKLFGVFQRLHRREDFEGTGIGLAIVQRIVHKHGGRVWAEGEVDKGATFYFTLAPSD